MTETSSGRKLNDCRTWQNVHAEEVKAMGESLAATFTLHAAEANGDDSIVNEVTEKGLPLMERTLMLHAGLAACVKCRGEMFIPSYMDTTKCPVSDELAHAAAQGKNYFEDFKPTAEG